MTKLLSVKETQVLSLTVMGLSIEDIAIKLSSHRSTIVTYILRIKAKMKLESKGDLLYQLVRRGTVETKIIGLKIEQGTHQLRVS